MLGTDALLNAIDSSPLPEDRVLRNELRAQVACALTALAPRESQLLVMKYIAQQSLIEISEELGISSEAVSSALQRARDAFRNSLRQVLNEDPYDVC